MVLVLLILIWIQRHSVSMKRSISKISDYFSRSNGSYDVQLEIPEGKIRKVNVKKRQTGVNPEWKKEYLWLDEHDNGMICNLCKRHQRRTKTCVPGKAVWVDVPCCSIMLQAVKRHKSSDSHKEAEAMERELALCSKQIEVGFEKEVCLNRLAMEKSMKCLYWLCKEEIAHTTKFKSLLDLCKDLGVDTLNALQQAGNATYTSERFLQEAIQSFRTVIMKKIYKQARESPFYAILVDETTDVSIKNELIIYIRFLNEKGESQTHFSKVVSLRDGKAQTITDAIKDHLTECSLPLNKLCALGSDGAAVMVGVKAGVAALLKSEVPHMLNNHCVAHRLALASSQAANSIPYLKKFKSIIEQLYRFYHYSPVRTSALQAIQDVLNDTRIKITQAKDVRWLSHDKSINSIRKTYEALITSLEREAQERSDVQAMGLSVFMQTYFFVAAMLMMCDILPVLSQLSRAMQKKDLNFSVVKPLVAATITTIKELKTTPGEHFQKLDEKILEFSTSQSFNFKTSDGQKEKFMNQVYQPYLLEVEGNLEKRFPDLPILECFQIFDPSILPDQLIDDEMYGTDEIKTLGNHFSLSEDDVLSEWRTTLHMMNNLQAKTAGDVMTQIVTQKEAFPNLAKLASAGLLIPTSTADCERGFSTLKRVKTDLRCNLSDTILNCLLAISMEGPSPQEFLANEYVNEWNQQKKRRIVF